MSIEELVRVMVLSIVDDEESVKVSTGKPETGEGTLIEVRVGKDDVGKVIGKKGRIATAIRTVARAAAAKNGEKIMVNVFNKPLGEEG